MVRDSDLLFKFASWRKKLFQITCWVVGSAPRLLSLLLPLCVSASLWMGLFVGHAKTADLTDSSPITNWIQPVHNIFSFYKIKICFMFSEIVFDRQTSISKLHWRHIYIFINLHINKYLYVFIPYHVWYKYIFSPPRLALCRVIFSCSGSVEMFWSISLPALHS